MKGRRHSAAFRQGRNNAQQSRRTAAGKRKASGPRLWKQKQQEAQMAATSRAKAAAAAQRRPSAPPPDNIPGTIVGESQAESAVGSLDWTAPSGRVTGQRVTGQPVDMPQGSGPSPNGAAISNGNGNGNGNGFWASLTPVHKTLLIAAGGFAAFKFFTRKKKR
jgi:hypothetical protein